MKTGVLLLGASLIVTFGMSDSFSAPNTKEFLQAIGSGDSAKVDQMLAQGVDVNARDEHGFTPLIVASFQGNLNAITILIEKGAALNALTDAGVTPLMGAVSSGHKEAVGSLLEKGADPNIKDDRGLNAFQRALMERKSEIAALLRPKTSVTTPMRQKVVVNITEPGKSCLNVQNFPENAAKKVSCLKLGQEVESTPIITNTQWTLIRRPVMGWIPKDNLKIIIVEEEKPQAPNKTATQGEAERSGTSRQAPSSDSTGSVSTQPPRGPGEWWRR